MLRSNVKSVEIPEIDGEELRKSIIERIEEITLSIIKDISSKKLPKITYYNFIPGNSDSSVQKNPNNQSEVIPGSRNGPLRENSRDGRSDISTSFDSAKSLSWVFDDQVASENPEVEGEVKGPKNSTTVDFRLKKSRKNLALMMTVMSDVHKMLINGTTKTRRSLYYQLQNGPTAGLVKTQRFVDDAVNHVASLLERAPWELGFTATSKGLVFGDLSLTFSGGKSIGCNVSGGLLIPQNMFRVTSATTRARCVVVVEKDTIFQKLLEEDCANYLNCILITGKGYPDVNTRMLVSLLGNELKIPVYVLVDADPFGVEIMCIYRFGSAIRSREVDKLACPMVRYLGVHPSEYSGLGITPKNITKSDISKLVSLEGRSYVDEKLIKQLKIIREKGKLEIEAVANLSYKFLTHVYMKQKINAGEFI